MAILVKCMTCQQKEVLASASYPYAECEVCQKKSGRYVKKWEEMTLEEKVENLNSRLRRREWDSTPIG